VKPKVNANVNFRVKPARPQKPPLHEAACQTTLSPVNSGEKPDPAADACCPDAGTCPLSAVEAGAVVCIKQLTAQQNVVDRLREMGLGEEQRIRLVSRHPSLICQVCNARVALSQDLAKSILVEPLKKTR
jgi:Fe2+ transport system protein FeoA